MQFEITDDANVALGLEFINDLYLPEQGEDRNVWLEPVRLLRMNDSIPFESMFMSREFPVVGDVLTRYWAGAVETPVLFITPGSYMFNWRARGSSAGGEYSKLRVTLLEHAEDRVVTKT